MTHFERPFDDPEDMRRWLNQRGEFFVVGERRRATACPLAHYLMARGYLNPSISMGDVMVKTRESAPYELVIELPAWAERFRQLIDDWPDYRQQGGITAREALEFLNQSLEEERRGNAA